MSESPLEPELVILRMVKFVGLKTVVQALFSNDIY